MSIVMGSGDTCGRCLHSYLLPCLMSTFSTAFTLSNKKINMLGSCGIHNGILCNSKKKQSYEIAKSWKVKINELEDIIISYGNEKERTDTKNIFQIWDVGLIDTWQGNSNGPKTKQWANLIHKKELWVVSLEERVVCTGIGCGVRIMYMRNHHSQDCELQNFYQ